MEKEKECLLEKKEFILCMKKNINEFFTKDDKELTCKKLFNDYFTCIEYEKYNKKQNNHKL